LGSNCLVINECDITKIDKTAIAVVASVSKEVDHGLRIFDRLACNRESAILSIAATSSEGTLMTVDSKVLSLSKEALRASRGFQLVLLGLPLLAVAGLFSVLFRRSSTGVMCLFASDVEMFCDFVESNSESSVTPAAPSEAAPELACASEGLESRSTSSMEDPEDLLRI
jgi:hypothetical protein